MSDPTGNELCWNPASPEYNKRKSTWVKCGTNEN